MRVLLGAAGLLALATMGLEAQLKSSTTTLVKQDVTAIDVSPTTVGKGANVTIRCHMLTSGIRKTNEKEIDAINAGKKSIGGDTQVFVSVDGYMVKALITSSDGALEATWRATLLPGSKTPLIGQHTATCMALSPGMGKSEKSTTFSVIEPTTKTASAADAAPGPQAAGTPQGGVNACVASLKVDLVPSLPPGAEGDPASSLMLPVQGSNPVGNRVVCSYGYGTMGVSMKYSFACTNPTRVTGNSWNCFTRTP